MDVDAPQNSFSGFGRELRQGHLEIAHAHAPQPAKAPVDRKGKQPEKNARHAARHAAQAARNGYNQPILEVFHT